MGDGVGVIYTGKASAARKNGKNGGGSLMLWGNAGLLHRAPEPGAKPLMDNVLCRVSSFFVQ